MILVEKPIAALGIGIARVHSFSDHGLCNNLSERLVHTEHANDQLKKMGIYGSLELRLKLK